MTAFTGCGEDDGRMGTNGNMEDLLAPAASAAAAREIRLVARTRCREVLEALPARWAAWARSADFSARPGELLLLPGDDGEVAAALAGAGPENAPPSIAPGALADKMPAGTWRFVFDDAPHVPPALAVLGWLLSAYRFDHYRGDENRELPRLAPPEEVDADSLLAQARAVCFGRNLVNTPALDLGPAELADQARALAEEFGAEFREVSGARLRRGYPMVHAVGMAAAEDRAPRLVDVRWGDAGPRVTLVGKGVCFDTGGLDIKPSSAMRLMKKDMGGAAAALACARMIMEHALPVRLRVLVPAVENAVSGPAFRPGDVLRSRKGLTVEVGNTDAEGRLILADALAAADEEEPALLVDFATLTGAARVALGPQLPAMFTDDDALAARLADIARAEDDPLWRLPLWKPYMEDLRSDIADTNNIAANGFAGAITAALFLSRFVDRAGAWLHLDIFGWNPKARPGRPCGGEVQGARAVFAYIREHVVS